MTTQRAASRPAIARVAAASLFCGISLLVAAPPAARAYPTASWVQEENARPGTSAWRIPQTAPDDIQGYASRVSAQTGDHVRLFVDTTAPTFHVVAYRLGYYQGLGGRRIWTSVETAGTSQPPPAIVGDTNTVEAGWARSLRFLVQPRFVQGSYLLKLVASTGGKSYVPLNVRDGVGAAGMLAPCGSSPWSNATAWTSHTGPMSTCTSGPSCCWRTVRWSC